MTPGEGSLQYSHRSELSGILGAILQMNDLCMKHKVESGRVELRCDGLGAVEIVRNLHDNINPNRKHFDIITSIQESLQCSPLTWTFAHVAGHQDDHCAVSLLDNWEYLNTIADTEAKAKLQTIRGLAHWKNDRAMDLPYEKCCITMTNPDGKEVKLGSNLSGTVYHYIHTKRI